MLSPFPGMDPYLQRFWGDVHQRLITYACDQIQDRLPLDLRARMQERLVIASPDEDSIYPDVHVAKHPDPPIGDEGEGGVAVATVVEVAKPLVIRLPRRRREVFIEIAEAGTSDRVVTVVEVLSPSNKKAGEGRRDYLRKVRDLRAGKVGIVEIDLIRGGHRGLGPHPADLPPAHRTPYLVSVLRGYKRDALEVYRLPLRERLPRIPVPLRKTDEDVPLDLQALVDLVYKNGRYGRDLNYRDELRPRLQPDDAAWADALLKETKRR